jgi:hypothetical protein
VFASVRVCAGVRERAASNVHMLSCLTRLVKFECLKYLGSSSSASFSASVTINVSPLGAHLMRWLFVSSSTIAAMRWYAMPCDVTCVRMGVGVGEVCVEVGCASAST